MSLAGLNTTAGDIAHFPPPPRPSPVRTAVVTHSLDSHLDGVKNEEIGNINRNPASKRLAYIAESRPMTILTESSTLSMPSVKPAKHTYKVRKMRVGSLCRKSIRMEDSPAQISTDQLCRGSSQTSKPERLTQWSPTKLIGSLDHCWTLPSSSSSSTNTMSHSPASRKASKPDSAVGRLTMNILMSFF